MKVKSFLIAIVLATAIFSYTGIVNAQTVQTQTSLQQQLIQLLTKMIAQLEQEIQQILAQQHTTTSIQPSIASLYKTDFDGGTLYANLYRSDDGGNMWNKILSAYKSSIVYAVASQNPNIIYAGDTSCNTMADTSKMCADLLKSSDKVETWTRIEWRFFRTG